VVICFIENFSMPTSIKNELRGVYNLLLTVLCKKHVVNQHHKVILITGNYW